MNPHISTIGSGLIAVLVLLVSSASGRAQQGLPGERVETARTLLEQLVKTRQMHSKEEADFNARMRTLQDQAELLRSQIDSLKAKTAERVKTNASIQETLDKLKEQKAAVVAGNQTLAEKVTGFEARTKGILEGLPEPLMDRIRPLAQAIPDPAEVAKNPKDPRFDLSRRFQGVVGILNAANKFNSEMTAEVESRELNPTAEGNGPKGIVTTLYLGIGQAFFVSQDGKTAGKGVSSLEGWKWSASENAEEIARAIRILQNKEPAGFVRLPVTIN